MIHVSKVLFLELSIIWKHKHCKILSAQRSNPIFACTLDAHCLNSTAFLLYSTAYDT